MLQHNVDANANADAAPAGAPGGPRAKRSAHAAHKAHALVVGAHVLCCGIPAALMLMAAGAGGSIGVSAAARYFTGAHDIIHAYELLILAVSAGLVALGGFLEWRAHSGRKVSFLFALSALCFAANLAVVLAHQDMHV